MYELKNRKNTNLENGKNIELKTYIVYFFALLLLLTESRLHKHFPSHQCSVFVLLLVHKGAMMTTDNIRTCEGKAGRAAPTVLTAKQDCYVGVVGGVLLMYTV